MKEQKKEKKGPKSAIILSIIGFIILPTTIMLGYLAGFSSEISTKECGSFIQNCQGDHAIERIRTTRFNPGSPETLTIYTTSSIIFLSLALLLSIHKPKWHSRLIYTATAVWLIVLALGAIAIGFIGSAQIKQGSEIIGALNNNEYGCHLRVLRASNVGGPIPECSEADTTEAKAFWRAGWDNLIEQTKP